MDIFDVGTEGEKLSFLKNNKFISLEDALSDISKTTNNRKETIEDILKEINKYDCSK